MVADEAGMLDELQSPAGAGTIVLAGSSAQKRGAPRAGLAQQGDGVGDYEGQENEAACGFESHHHFGPG